jgi:hypothetical protein
VVDEWSSVRDGRALILDGLVGLSVSSKKRPRRWKMDKVVTVVTVDWVDKVVDTDQ